MDYSSSSLSLQVSSSSRSTTTTTTTTTDEKQQQLRLLHPESHPSLHVIRKPPAKPWRKPALPPAPKVYRVDPHGFRRLVQRLTGMSEDQQAARPQPPAPIQVGPQPVQQAVFHQQQHAMNNNNRVAASGHQEQQSPAGMKGLLSPSFYSNWCPFPLLSPGSMAALEF